MSKEQQDKATKQDQAKKEEKTQKNNGEKNSASPNNASKESWIKETLIIFLLALAVALVIKTFLVDTRLIPSASMYPTIEVGDRVLVDKITHIVGKTPERGDIVVFRAPAELNQKSDLIKRVIGLPGDTIFIKDGLVYINDEAIAEDYLNEAPDYEYGPVTVPEGCYFMLGDNRNHSVDAHRWSDPFISIKDIKGKAFFCYWPINRIGDLY